MRKLLLSGLAALLALTSPSRCLAEEREAHPPVPTAYRIAWLGPGDEIKTGIVRQWQPGGNWLLSEGQAHHEFREIERADGLLFLRDESRGVTLRFPVAGGNLDIAAPPSGLWYRTRRITPCDPDHPPELSLADAKPLPSRSYSGTEGYEQPKIVNQVHPRYPAQAKAEKRNGVVVVETTIGTDGKSTGEVIVLRGDPELAVAAVEAVTQWTFEPARLGGQAIASPFTMTVNFTIK